VKIQFGMWFTAQFQWTNKMKKIKYTLYVSYDGHFIRDEMCKVDEFDSYEAVCIALLDAKKTQLIYKSEIIDSNGQIK